MFNLKLTLQIGLFIGLFFIVIWILWATLVYKWNTDRLGDMILKKYSATHQSLLTDDLYFNYTNVVLSADKSHVTADIQLKNKVNQKILKIENIKYNIVTDGSCKLTDFKCIGI
jgi:hypothetical protein